MSDSKPESPTHSGRALVRALVRVAGFKLGVVSLLHTAWWIQAPVAIALRAPGWVPIALGALLSPARLLAQQSLRRVLRREALARSAAQALARPMHAVPESDTEAAFWSAHIAEYAVSTTVPLAAATSVTVACSLAIFARATGVTATALLVALLVGASIATLFATHKLTPRANAAVDARQHTAVWLAAALRGGSEIRGELAHAAYLDRVRAAVRAWCVADDALELRRDLARAAIAVIAVTLAVALAPWIAPSLRLDFSEHLPSTVALLALLPAGYGALRAMSDLWVTVEELRRLDRVLTADAPLHPRDALLSSRPIALRAEGLALRYGAHLALEAGSLSVATDGLVLVTGPNGAGKSTFAAAITGAHTPSAGTLCFVTHEESTRCMDVDRSQIALVPQEPALIEALSIRDNMTLAAPSAADELLTRALARVGLDHPLDHLVGDLSRGQRQRVGLARALLTDPLVLVLDEPDAWLDARGRAQLLDVLREESTRRSVVVISHRDELRAIAKTVVAVSSDHRATVEPA